MRAATNSGFLFFYIQLSKKEMILRKEIDSSNDSNFKDIKEKSSKNSRVVCFSSFEKEKKIKNAKRRVNAAANNLAW